MNSNKLRNGFWIIGLALLTSLPTWCQGNVFNCSSFTSSGTCGANTGSGPFFFVNGFSSLSGGVVTLLPTGQTHIVTAMNYTTKVGTTGFNSSWTFVPNGQFLAFVLQNHPGNAAAASGINFNSGAGCESGFFQSSVQPANVEYIFAMEFDSYNPLAISPPGSGAFSYSSVQIYQTIQSPCSAQGAETQWWGSTKRSTSPVALNSPSGTQNTTTGDTYIAFVGYDGSTFSLCLADTTLGNNCTSSTAGTGTIFTTTWSNVSIPSLVNGTTAYLGFTTADGLAASFPLNIASWQYTTVTPTASVSSGGVQSGGAVQASNPTLSPAAGSYTGTQNVTITCPTTSSYACYALGSAGLTIMPLTDNYGGCTATGTLYSSAVTVSSSQTLYAVCGMNNNITTPSGLAANINSGIVQAAYTIGSTPNLTISGNAKVSGNVVIQ